MSNINLINSHDILRPNEEKISREEFFNRLEQRAPEFKKSVWHGREVKKFENNMATGTTVAINGLWFSSIYFLIASNPVSLIIGASIGGTVILAGLTYYAISSVRKYFYFKKEINANQIDQKIRQIYQTKLHEDALATSKIMQNEVEKEMKYFQLAALRK